MSRLGRVALTLPTIGLLMTSAAAGQTAGSEASQIEIQAVTGTRNSYIEGSTCSKLYGDYDPPVPGGPIQMHRAYGGQVLMGGAVRVHRDRRIGLSAEVTVARACAAQAFTYYHPRTMLLFQGLRDIGHAARVRPYVVFGGGLVRHGQLYSSASYPNPGLILAGGGGARIALSREVLLSPEFQFGVDGNLFARFTIGVGLRVR